MHTTSNLKDNYLGSGTIINRSIKKYGAEKHIREIIEFLDNQKDLQKRESEIVNEKLLKDPKCMNLKIGGKGGFSLDQQYINGINGHKKMEWLRENNEIWAKEYILSRIKNLPDWNGKKHNKKTKEKLVSKFKEIKHQQGNKNSQFGTKWITNGKESKKIKKDIEIPSGWKKGRK